jgi:hypothetical protein
MLIPEALSVSPWRQRELSPVQPPFPSLVGSGFMFASFVITQWILLFLGLVIGIMGIIFLCSDRMLRMNEHRMVTIDHVV